jgi:DnaJ-class molecular chaperone
MKRHFRTSVTCLKNFYQDLGVKPHSSDSDIKKAYFALAKKYHPDLNPAPEAKTQFE